MIPISDLIFLGLVALIYFAAGIGVPIMLRKTLTGIMGRVAIGLMMFTFWTVPGLYIAAIIKH